MKKLVVLVSFWLIVGMMTSGMLGCAATNVSTPLPEILNITSPNPNIGEIAKCSGIWEGRWDNTYFQATTVILEKIDSTEVVAVYAWGSYQGSPGNWIRVFGKIINSSTIILEWGEKEQRRTVTLTLVSNNLKAEYRKAGQINRATLTKVPMPIPKSQ